ncbi:carbon-nitrogen hydrolase family protein [Piscirickettsia litoralis]|uniref:CN hydrolase domain-containing protein n=1 Tax=Piscirickettsia litoralis TaxID=1891921 RepID=A0ABX3A1Y7_9GAMM|nr:hypothetical protein [Piscirickettsia litoralis]ODN41455.1 hypothetical protein BGC07_15140 [Piscirickettsia litoralis]
MGQTIFLRTNIELKKKGLAVCSDDEYLEFCDRMKQLQDKIKTNTLVISGSILHANKGKGTYQITALILRQGEKELIFYHKRNPTNDIGFVSPEGPELTCVAGEELGTFQYRGVNFGIEICLDHQNRALINQGSKPLDVQILIADGQCPTARNTHLVPDGYFIHSELDHKNPDTESKKKYGSTSKITATSSGPSKHAPIH